MRAQIYKKGNTLRNYICMSDVVEVIDPDEVRADDRKFAIGAALGFTELSLVDGVRPDAGDFLALIETIYNFLNENKDGK